MLVVTFGLQGRIREDKETGSFVSYSPALDIYSAGKTRMEAKEALRCAANLFIGICYERGILWEVLRNRGFELAQGNQSDLGMNFVSVERQPQKTIQADYDDVFPLEVPLDVIAAIQQGEIGRLQ